MTALPCEKEPRMACWTQWIRTSTSFLHQWWQSPRTVGAICSSSKQLAQWMQIASEGWVVEIGGGTDAVTAALLRSGRLIQFSHALRAKSPWHVAGLDRIASETVWFNLPPARIEVLQSCRSIAARPSLR